MLHSIILSLFLSDSLRFSSIFSAFCCVIERNDRWSILFFFVYVYLFMNLYSSFIITVGSCWVEKEWRALHRKNTNCESGVWNWQKRREKRRNTLHNPTSLSLLSLTFLFVFLSLFLLFRTFFIPSFPRITHHLFILLFLSFVFSLLRYFSKRKLSLGIRLRTVFFPSFYLLRHNIPFASIGCKLRSSCFFFPLFDSSFRIEHFISPPNKFLQCFTLTSG